jgi:uncharacterized membrane protein YdjX (TVP38/TMEM64 family)
MNTAIMFIENIGFKDHMIISLIASTVRTIGMLATGYKDSEHTWKEGWCIWSAASLAAMGIYAIGRRMSKAEENTALMDETVARESVGGVIGEEKV